MRHHDTSLQSTLPRNFIAKISLISLFLINTACTKQNDSPQNSTANEQATAPYTEPQGPAPSMDMSDAPNTQPPPDAPNVNTTVADVQPGQQGMAGENKTGTGATGTGAYDTQSPRPSTGASGGATGASPGIGNANSLPTSPNSDTVNPQTNTTETPAEITFARSELAPKSGSKVAGTVTFTVIPAAIPAASAPQDAASPQSPNSDTATPPVTSQTDQVVMVTAEIKGASPGEHGFHIHEKGDCSAPDASTAGEHWNPANTAHGGVEGEKRHAGDLGNIRVNDNGEGRITMRMPFVAGVNLQTDLIGRSVVVHAAADDLTSQPSGNSGDRIACGTIVQVASDVTH